jgi:hypothetical protein
VIAAAGAVAGQAQPALVTRTYHVQDLVGPSAWVLDRPVARPLGETESSSPAERLVREIISAVAPDSWGTTAASPTIQVENGTKLVIRATDDRHKQVADFLGALRRLADVAVVMNARLHEVDRAFYVEQVVPLLGNPRQPAPRRLVVYPNDELLEKLKQQKLVLLGRDTKIPSGQQATFLSWQQAVRYVAQPADPEIGQKKVYRTALEGVTFLARPRVTADRRFIYLKLTQQVVQLAKGAKIKVDEGTRFEELVALPDNESATATTVLVPDGGALLVPVDYRPPAAKGQERVWLLVLRPQIWIEEEERQIRQAEKKQ